MFRLLMVVGAAALFTACGGDEDFPEYEPFEAPYCVEQFDREGDGVFDESYTATFGDGLILSRAVDFGADGTIDGYQTYEHDRRGNMTQAAWDGNLDGVTNALDSWTFDDRDNETSYRRDDNNDGIFEYATDRFYSADGILERLEIDSIGDGSIDRIWRYTADEAGNLVRSDVSNANGDALSHWLMTYEGSLRVTETEYGTTGKQARSREYGYDDRGRLISHRLVAPNQGSLLVEYQWDDRDRFIQLDGSGFGQNYRRSRTYDCAGI